MVRSISSHSIAPASVLRGDGSWDEALPQIKSLCSSPLVLGRSDSTADQRQRLVSDLLAHGLQPLQAQLQFDCCEQDLQRLAAEAQGCDAVLAAGSQNGVTALGFSSQPLEILLTAVELKLSLKRLEPMGQEIRHQTLSLIGSGVTATQHQRT